jgi:integrase
MEKSLDDAAVKRLVDTYIKDTLDSLKHYVNGLEAVSRDMAQGQLEAIIMMQSEQEEALFRRDYSGIKHVVDLLLDGREVDKMSHNKLSRAVLQTAIKLGQIQIDAYQGEIIPDSLEDHKDVTTESIPEPEPVDLGPILSEFITEHHAANPGWSQATLKEYESCAKVVLKILGDVPVGTLDRPTMVNYRKTLMNVPTYWVSRHKDIPASKLPIKGVETIKKQTVEKNLAYVSGLIRAIVDTGYLQEITMPVTPLNMADDSIDVLPFDNAMVRTIMAQTESPKDYRHWLVRLGYYTGARSNELCQLHKADIRKVGGVWCIDINEEDEKTVKGRRTKKKKASVRVVPIHPVIIETGFMEYVKGVRHKQLFPECERNPKGKYNETFGKWFNKEILVKHGIKKKGSRERSFHSWRHGLVTILKRQGADHTLVQQLAGHAMQGVTDREYFEGHLPDKLKEGVKLIPDHRTL